MCFLFSYWGVVYSDVSVVVVTRICGKTPNQSFYSNVCVCRRVSDEEVENVWVAFVVLRRSHT